mmetsp:Transcript_4694/g.6090  ORF Transcript_4694/g.6090 Transcript_4694/m.6090 type:complete len:89 (+) Transcript_4694:612-878(+)
MWLHAFEISYSLISADSPLIVQFDDDSFVGCRTLELRQQQVDVSRLNEEHDERRIRETRRYLKHRFDILLIHMTTTSFTFYNKRMNLV